MNTEPQEIRLQLTHIELAAKAWGNPRGLPVLGLHGWLDNAATFDAIGPLLPHFYFVALDFPGHGLSEHRPVGTVYHIMDYVAEIFDVADVLGWEKFSIIGHSMGAALAGLAAAAFPERIERLVLLDFLGTLPCNIADTPKRMGQHIKELKRRRVLQMPLYASKEAMIQARHKTGNIPDDVARLIIERGVKPMGDKYTWSSDPRLTVTPLLLMPEDQLSVCLEAIECPVLLFLSETTFPHYRELFLERIKQVPIIETVILGETHYLHFEEAQSIARKIEEFFQ